MLISSIFTSIFKFRLPLLLSTTDLNLFFNNYMYAVHYNFVRLNILVAFTIFCVLFLTYLDKWYQVLISANYCFSVMEMIVSVMEMVICIIQNFNLVAFLVWDIQYYGYEWLQYSCTVIFTWYANVLQKYCDAAMVPCFKTMVLYWMYINWIYINDIE